MVMGSEMSYTESDRNAKVFTKFFVLTMTKQLFRPDANRFLTMNFTQPCYKQNFQRRLTVPNEFLTSAYNMY